MIRRLFITAAVLSMLICFASTALAYYSTQNAYRVAYDRAYPEEHDIFRRECSVVCSKGSFSLTFGKRWYDWDRYPSKDPRQAARLVYPCWRVEEPSNPWDWRRSALSVGMVAQGVELFDLRIGSESWSNTRYDHYEAWRAAVPCWFVSLLAAILPVRWLWGKRTRRVRSETGHCPICGYDMRGSTSGVCPECGTPGSIASVAQDSGV